jgi:hypothetical protein
MNKQTLEMTARLQQAGISLDDARALRRIAMALHRWFELECGNGNAYGSWVIARGRKNKNEFVYDDDGKPYIEHHHYLHGKGKDYITYSPIPDRETGARKRLATIMARYPGFQAYVPDPRGAPLYILPPGTLGDDDIKCVYSRGIAVYK